MRHHTPDTPLAIATLHPQLPRPVQALEDASALAVVFSCEAFEFVLCAGHADVEVSAREVGGGSDDGGVGIDGGGGEERDGWGKGREEEGEEERDEVDGHFNGGDAVGLQ